MVVGGGKYCVPLRCHLDRKPPRPLSMAQSLFSLPGVAISGSGPWGQFAVTGLFSCPNLPSTERPSWQCPRAGQQCQHSPTWGAMRYRAQLYWGQVRKGKVSIDGPMSTFDLCLLHLKRVARPKPRCPSFGKHQQLQTTPHCSGRF